MNIAWFPMTFCAMLASRRLMPVTCPHLFFQSEAASIYLFLSFSSSVEVFRNLLSLKSLPSCKI